MHGLHILVVFLRNHVYLVLAILVVLGGTAYAAGTNFIGVDGTIRGCVNTKRVVSVLKPPKKKCAVGLSALTWNQKGPIGKTGPRGLQGIQGIQGLQGPKGDKGDQGVPGPSTGPASGDLTGSYPGPTIAAGAVTAAKVAAANKDGLASVPSLRTLGTGAQQAMPGNAAPGGPPTGSASGDLTGSYPGPTIAAGKVTDAKVATANKDGLANVPSLRTLGTGAQQAMPGNATPGGPPTGSAGGALSGTYPSPSLNVAGTGSCDVGQFLTKLSSQVPLTCAPADINTALGVDALDSATDEDAEDTAVGFDALTDNTTGLRDTAVGVSALSSNTIGDDNTAVGIDALDLNDTGSTNSALGAKALNSNQTGSGNSALGASALHDNTADGNSAVGSGALENNTSGGGNVAVGLDALNVNQTGVDNTAVGSEALRDSDAAGNTAVGSEALRDSDAAGNSALGAAALASNTSGASNVAFGLSALDANTTGGGNTAIGADALGSKIGGSNNVAVGKGAGDELGNNANSNTLLGTDGGGALTTNDSSNIDIGHAGVPGDGHTIRIGTQGGALGQQNKAFMAGVNTNTVDQNTPVLVGSDGELGSAVSSSRRFKKSIRPLGAMSRLMRLRPVSYLYREPIAAGSHRLQYGLIAEEVARVMPRLVQRDSKGRPSAVMYGDLPVLLLAKVKDQQREIRAQDRRIERLEAQMSRLLGGARSGPDGGGR